MADLITCTGVPPAPAHNARWRRCLKRGTDEVAASAAIQSRSISSKPFVVRRYTENAQILRSSRMSADQVLLAVQPAAGCYASETMLSTVQPVCTRYRTCSHRYQSHDRADRPTMRCIQRSGGSCSAAHSSLRYLRPLARLTRRNLARVTGPFGTSTRSTGSRRGQPYDVVVLIAHTGYYGACGRDTARVSASWPNASESRHLLAPWSRAAQPPGSVLHEPVQMRTCAHFSLVSCARAMSRLVCVQMRCVGRASKFECRELCIVVIYHVHTRGSLGYDGGAHGSPRRDRPFRHSYTIVPTPCTQLYLSVNRFITYATVNSGQDL